MIHKIVSFLAVAIFTLFFLWGIGFLWFALDVSTMKPESSSGPVEAIIVLTGGENRVKTGLDLLEAGESDKLFISGVNPKTNTQDILKMWNHERHEAPCCITLGYKAQNTEENARETKNWIEKNSIQSIRLVTSDYHMSRSLLEFKKGQPGLTILPHPVRSNDISVRHTKFWKLIFGEYNKTILTWLRLQRMSQEITP